MSDLNKEIFKQSDVVLKKIIAIKKQVASSFDLSYAETRVLLTLGTQKLLSQSEMSELCEMDKPQTCRIIMKLLIKKYVKRDHKEGNHKSFYVSLTDKGVRTANSMNKMYQELSSWQLNKLNEQEKNNLLEILNKVLL